MIISNHVNNKHFVSNEKMRTINNETLIFFQNELSDIMSKKELASNDNPLALYSDMLLSLQNCKINNEKVDKAIQSRNNEITEDDEKIKSSFEICLECDHKDECENYKKMIEDNESMEENTEKLNKIFLQEQLYKLTGSSFIYNYNIICPDMNIKTKREKR